MNALLINLDFSRPGFRTSASAFIIKSLSLLLFSSLFAVQGHAQTTESVTVKGIAGDSPEWIVKMARADDFREPDESPALESRSYSEATIGRAKQTGPVYHQPAGALTGKMVFAMAGHGWTYDAEEMYYYTQRGLSNGMVEDLGNADQMHIFAHMAFNAGATVIPFRPIDYQPNERIMDNSMPQVEYFGDWRAGTSDRFHGSPADAVPYAVANASLQETAVARYRPYIPESGYYPVYAWARDGGDRSNQLYRIAHSGGQAEIRVNWRRAGKAWVWLGTYYFNVGDTGYVEASNQVLDPYEAYNGNVVVADAIRFGNGRGDVQRPAGVSGFSREDEGDSYWIQRSLGANTDRRIFDAGSDGNSTVSSPPKAAAHVNRETEGSFFDRILISFHSNASTGKARGAIALFNAKAEQRPTYQESLAEILGEEINSQMTVEDQPAKAKWSDRVRNTYSGINFGELRRDYIQNEMCATIVESAFHDNADDAKFLLDPMARIQIAQATLRGLLRWYSEIAYPNSANVLPPARPVAVSATNDDGQINVKWKTGPTGGYAGGPAEKIRVYRSPNGYGFDGGTAADSTSKDVTLDPLTTAGVTFIRVTAVNSAGESFPSQTIAVGVNGSKVSTPKTLVMPVTTVLDSSTNVSYDLGRQPGGPYRDSARTERVRAVYAMTEPSGAAEAYALAAAGQQFDGADTAAFEDKLVDKEAYKRIFMTAETQNPNTPLISENIENQLRSFLNRNGKLYVSGSEVADNLYKRGGAHRTFLGSVFGITGTKPAPTGELMASTDDRFFPTSATLTLSAIPNFWQSKHITPGQLQLREGRSLELINYLSVPGTGVTASLTRPTPSEGEVVFFGFPLSLIQGDDNRQALMKAVLKQM